jgi:hypothetical protein
MPVNPSIAPLEIADSVTVEHAAWRRRGEPWIYALDYNLVTADLARAA